MIERAEIDGVPALLVPAAGPTRGGLTFRVGWADESLPRSGITHLIEHLALHRLGLTDYHYNGATGAVVTHFVSEGSPDDVGDYLNGVCAALSDLPYDRMQMEKEILRTESSSRSRSVAEPLAVWRYGAGSHGLSSYPEWGLGALTPDDVRAWIARYFTRDNAMIWISGTVPTNLRLSLAAGTRQPMPKITSALPDTPAYFVGPTRAIAFQAIVPRSLAGQVFAGVLERELFRTLRQEGGYSYTATAAYEPRGDQSATIVALADALPEKQAATLGGFVDVLAKLRVGRIEQSDVEATVQQGRDALRHPDFETGRLPSVAFSLLLDHPLRTVDELERELDGITITDLHRVAEQSVSSGLLMVPEGHTADWAGFVAAPTSSPTAVAGQRFPMRNEPECALVIGTDGVSVTGPSTAATVLFDQCAVMLAWPDGGRMLIGDDAITCRVEPTLYPVDQATLQRLDSAVRPELLVPLPPRPADAIPQPGAPTFATKAQSPAKYRKLTIAALVLLLPPTLVCLLFSVVATGLEINRAPEQESLLTGVVVFWFGTVCSVAVCWWLYRRLRRRTA